MNKKTALDIAIFISCLTGMILSYVYLENDTEQKMSLLIFGIIGICFIVLAVMDKNRPEEKTILRQPERNFQDTAFRRGGKHNCGVGYLWKNIRCFWKG